ncbi:MAG: glycine--tRNA ligase, partial [Candidatus Gracilibacteria bacterium]
KSGVSLCVKGMEFIEDLRSHSIEGKSNDELFSIVEGCGIKCPHCEASDWTIPRSFNLMFKTYQGVVEETAALVYLRPETAQGIFTNFKNVLNTSRKKIPFGIAQIGKSFRNEITPGNFTFRTREFEQMEIEYFIKEKDWEPLFDEWEKAAWDFFKKLGIAEENLRFRQHDSKELSHYSKRTKDVEYRFPFGWGELMGLAYRTDFDLRRHMEFSGEKLTVLEEGQEPFIPHVIEPSFGVDRTLLTVLLDAYHEDEVEGEIRVVMRFAKALAPIKVAVLPLSKKLEDDAKKVSDHLKKFFSTEFDVSGSIGKRYRRQDEIGTPYCVTFDFDSLNDQKVTVRDRDAMTQDRVPIEGLERFLGEGLSA